MSGPNPGEPWEDFLERITIEGWRQRTFVECAEESGHATIVVQPCSPHSWLPNDAPPWPCRKCRCGRHGVHSDDCMGPEEHQVVTV